MESKGAIAMFKRSIEKRCLKYTQFVGDGDSSCFGKVVQELKACYGESYSVQKEECVGHIQKRMGSALLQYKKNMKGKKLSDGKGVGGAGRLTKDVIKQIQNYYGLAIRQNKGNLKGMKNGINAILHHVVTNSKKPLSFQHRFCPRGKESWCRFWRDKANKSKLYKETHRLSDVFFKELQPIFKRLSESDLLQRCLLGLTQNQNESINGRLWSSVPKTKFCGKRRIIIGVCETICKWNTGASSKFVIMERLGVNVGRNTLLSLRQEDKNRLTNSARQISEKYRLARKKKRLTKKKGKNEAVSYKAGSFGLGAKPDLPTKCNTDRKDGQKRRKLDFSEKNETVDITFINENSICQFFQDKDL
eukprot:gene13659-15089_t